MKFRQIFRFEFAYQVRRPWPWLICGVLVLFTFLFVRENYVADALYADFFVNAPFLIAGTTVIGGLIWLLLAAIVAGEAGARDLATGMHPLTYTTPVSKSAYLGGRFLAAFVLNALLLLGVQTGSLLGVYAPGVPAEMIGPFRLAAYLTAYAYIALPTAFVATAIQFALATRSGRGMAGYAGSLLLIFTGFFVASILLFRRGLGTLLDPIGIRFIVEDLAHTWTTVEQNQRLLGLEGPVLTNRLLWLGIGLGVLMVTYLRFHFAHRTERSPFSAFLLHRAGWWRRISTPTPTSARMGVTARTPITVPQVPLAFGFATHVQQTRAIAWASFHAIATSWAGLTVLLGIPLLTVLVVLDQMSSLGTPLVPTTARILSELTAPLSAELSRWVIVPLIIVFFAGELVWRERDAGMDEITDALPGSEWALFLGKFLGLSLVLALFMAFLMAAGVLAQVILGYQTFELWLYLSGLFGLQLPEYLLFALLALVVHGLVAQKYVGHLVAVMVYVFIVALASMLGIEHNLLIYGAGPMWSYTPMRGFGASIEPWLWFKLYWAAWALLLAVAARLLWGRGRDRALRVRLRTARSRLTLSTVVTSGVATALICALGGFIFYNTNVLNKYQSTAASKERQAEYERRYGQYENLPQPELTGTNLRIEIYPEQRMVAIHGSYRLVNDRAAPIDTIHLTTAMDGVVTQATTFDRAATVVVNDEDHGYRIYALAQPLQPGATLRLDFAVQIVQHGFGNRGVDPAIEANGSYFTNAAWFPIIGYQRLRQLISAADRRMYGLAPRPLLASLNDADTSGLTTHRGGVTFEAVLGTAVDQIAVAPGALRRTWTEGGRRYFHYSTDAPIGNEWAFFSAHYAVHEVLWQSAHPADSASGQAVTIRIFHHPKHTANLDRMVRSIRASLDYYTKQFGPYPYRHLTVVENPGAPGDGLHADASLISYGQGFSTWIPQDDGESLDLPFAVVAHEVAHQWTVPIAFVEGAPVMSESLAWYYGMQVVRESYGDAELRRLLSFMRQPYPYAPIRRGEPLLRGLDPYMSYRRGPFALFALSEYMGTAQVNTALRRLVEKHRAAASPLATTLDLYHELQAVTPDALQSLLHDLFAVNTFWELATERVTAEQTQAGPWQVTLDVRARKVVVDEAGGETVAPMNEPVQIGIFAAGTEGDELGAPLYVQMHPIRSGAQTITVTVPGQPLLAGIDPYHLLDVIELGDDDNIEPVSMKGEGR